MDPLQLVDFNFAEHKNQIEQKELWVGIRFIFLLSK